MELFRAIREPVPYCRFLRAIHRQLPFCYPGGDVGAPKRQVGRRPLGCVEKGYEIELDGEIAHIVEVTLREPDTKRVAPSSEDTA